MTFQQEQEYQIAAVAAITTSQIPATFHKNGKTKTKRMAVAILEGGGGATKA